MAELDWLDFTFYQRIGRKHAQNAPENFPGSTAPAELMCGGKYDY